MPHSYPRVTVGLGCEYMLVPSHEILRWSETTAQENLLEVLREGIGGDEVRRLAERCGFAGDPSDLAAIARCVAREIVSGRLVPIAMPEPQRGLTPIFSRNERRFDWADAVPLSSLRERESTVDIPWRARIVMDDGAAIARHEVELMLPGAAPRTLDTDARGEVGLKGLADADLVTVTLAPVAVARWRGAADGFVTSQHRAAFPFAVPAVFELPAGELQTVVLGRPLVQRIATDTIRFARDSSMLVPLVASHSHLVALATAIATLTRTADARLLAVGHASADGNAASNAALGLQRAQCVRHLMAGDRDRWVALATEHGTPAVDSIAAMPRAHGLASDIAALRRAAADNTGCMSALRRAVGKPTDDPMRGIPTFWKAAKLGFSDRAVQLLFDADAADVSVCLQGFYNSDGQPRGGS